MVWVIFLVIAIVISGVALAYNLGKRDGAEEAYEHINMVMEVFAEMIQEQQEKENFENIFEEFK